MNLFGPRFEKLHNSPPAGLARLVRFGESSRWQSNGIADLGSASEHASVVRWQQDQATLNLTTQRIRCWNHAHDLGRQLLNLLEDTNIRVLRVDLACIESVSSETLAQLARVHCRASQLGKKLLLANVTDPVREVLHVTRLDRLFGMSDLNQSQVTSM